METKQLTGSFEKRAPGGKTVVAPYTTDNRSKHSGFIYSISRNSYVFVGCDGSNDCDRHFVSLAAYSVQSSLNRSSATWDFVRWE